VDLVPVVDLNLGRAPALDQGKVGVGNRRGISRTFR
jgi:hypothetical protein